MLLTAIINEETVLVKAIKRRRKKATTSLLPSRALMVYGITKPDNASDSVNGYG